MAYYTTTSGREHYIFDIFVLTSHAVRHKERGKENEEREGESTYSWINDTWRTGLGYSRADRNILKPVP
jgi:hypothetical protein